MQSKCLTWVLDRNCPETSFLRDEGLMVKLGHFYKGKHTSLYTLLVMPIYQSVFSLMCLCVYIPR